MCAPQWSPPRDFSKLDLFNQDHRHNMVSGHGMKSEIKNTDQRTGRTSAVRWMASNFDAETV